jgi:hypothetical protein
MRLAGTERVHADGGSQRRPASTSGPSGTVAGAVVGGGAGAADVAGEVVGGGAAAGAGSGFAGAAAGWGSVVSEHAARVVAAIRAAAMWGNRWCFTVDLGRGR